jgi:hypothetical protein
MVRSSELNVDDRMDFCIKDCAKSHINFIDGLDSMRVRGRGRSPSELRSHRISHDVDFQTRKIEDSLLREMNVSKI